MGELVNSLGIGAFIGGLAIAISLKYNGAETWRFTTLLCGVILLMISVLLHKCNVGSNQLADILLDHNQITKMQNAEAHQYSDLWSVVVPLVFGGIGVNAVSNRLISSMPRE